MDFITNIVFGWVSVRLDNLAPQLAKILPFLGRIADFMVDGALLVLTGLTTLVHWGYKFVEMGLSLIHI